MTAHPKKHFFVQELMSLCGVVIKRNSAGTSSLHIISILV